LSRPISLSVISVLTISYGILSLIPKIVFLLPSQQSEWASEQLRTIVASGPVPLPLWLHYSHALISSVLWIIAGIFVWKGANWSRWLMTFWGLSVLFLTASVYGFSGSFPWKCGTYMIGIYFLFKQSSRQYFAESARLKDP